MSIESKDCLFGISSALLKALERPEATLRVFSNFIFTYDATFLLHEKKENIVIQNVSVLHTIV